MPLAPSLTAELQLRANDHVPSQHYQDEISYNLPADVPSVAPSRDENTGELVRFREGSNEDIQPYELEIKSFLDNQVQAIGWIVYRTPPSVMWAWR
jgi:hypothetical protein